MAFNYNPIMSEWAGVSPALKGALATAGQNLAQQNVAPPAAAITAAQAPSVIPHGMLLPHPDAGPEPAPISMGSTTPSLSMPPMSSASPQLVTGPNRGQAMMTTGQQVHQGTLLGDQTVRDEGSGISQISGKIQNSGLGEAHPLLGKILGGLAQGAATAGDIALRVGGGGMGQLAEQMIPGTEGHHELLVRQNARDVAAAASNAQKQAQTASENANAQHTAAETPEIAPLAEAKIASENAAVGSAKQKNAATLAKSGFKLDENGSIVPMAYEEMSPSQQSSYDLKNSQQQLADSTETLREAQSEVERAKNDPNSPAYQMAIQRLGVARQNAQAAGVRAQASMGRYLQSAFNTDLHGNYLPGAPQIENEAGNVTTVGTGNASQARQAQASAAQFNDVHGALDSVEGTAKKLTDSGGKLNSPMVIAAMQAPHTTISRWIHSLSNYTLSPQERDYVMSNIALHENIQGLRKSAGGAATDSQVENLLKMAPGGTTPDLDYLTRQIEQIRQTAERLGKGVTTARGGLNVRGQNANKPAPTANPGTVPPPGANVIKWEDVK